MIRAALVTAGGQGVRMASDIPKQYIDLDGVPILSRTILAFQDHPLIDIIAVTVPPGDEEFCRSRLIERFNLGKVQHVVAGGKTRQLSVFNGLLALEHTDIVAIHDGVRPLVSLRTIAETFRAAERSGAALACLPARDTIKKRTGPMLETIDRADMWLAHTPQTFRTSLILAAHRKAMQDGFEATDDACLVERMGHPLEVVEDSLQNIKITTPDDLELARLLMPAAGRS